MTAEVLSYGFGADGAFGFSGSSFPPLDFDVIVFISAFFSAFLAALRLSFFAIATTCGAPRRATVASFADRERRSGDGIAFKREDSMLMLMTSTGSCGGGGAPLGVFAVLRDVAAVSLVFAAAPRRVKKTTRKGPDSIRAIFRAAQTSRVKYRARRRRVAVDRYQHRRADAS
jgi:hypothetical protein